MESSTTNDVAQDLSESLWNESDPLNPLITVFAVLSFQILPMSVPVGLSATCLFACRACLLIWSSQAYYLSVCRFVAVSARLHIQWHASWAAQRFQIRQRCHAHRITSHNYTLVTLLDHLIASCQISLHLVSWALAPGTISSATTSPTSATSATSPTGDTSTVTASSGEVEPSTSRAGVPAQGVACTWCIVNLYFDLYTL